MELPSVGGFYVVTIPTSLNAAEELDKEYEVLPEDVVVVKRSERQGNFHRTLLKIVTGANKGKLVWIGTFFDFTNLINLNDR